MAIVFQSDAGLGRGIEQAGSALGQAFQKRGNLAQEEEKRKRQQSTLDAVLKWVGDIPEGQSMGQNLGALQSVLQEGDFDPAVVQSIIGEVIKKNLEPAQRKSQKDMTPFEKKKSEKTANLLFDTVEGIPQLVQSRRNLNRLKELAPELQGLTGYGAAIIGSRAAREFDALGLSALEPVLKIFNPRGVIPQRKIEMLKEQFAPTSMDTRWEIQGKLQALESFTANAEAMSQKLMDLYQKHGEDIPIEELLAYENQANQVIDQAMQGKGIKDTNDDGVPDKKQVFKPTAANAKQLKGKTIVNPETGEKLKSNGNRWVKVSK